MNCNVYKIKDKSEYFNSFNKKKLKKYKGKITEKLINMNKDNYIQKIQEFKITLKNIKIKENDLKSPNYIKSKKSLNSNKVKYNEPYLKPKFKNKNSLSIKKDIKKSNFNNDEMKNIYLDFFKIYYDENGKRVKIIKNKQNYKENKSKELVLTQNKKYLNNNNWTNINKNKLKKNIKTELFDIKNGNNNNDDNKDNKDNNFQLKYVFPEIPPQNISNENEDKSNGKNINKINQFLNNPKDNNINQSNNNFIHKNIYYESLPSFLKIRNNKNINDYEKHFKKNTLDTKIVLNNTEQLSSLEQSLNKIKIINNNIKENLLKIRNKSNEFNRILKINNSIENKLRNENNKGQKINYFHNDISNLTLNMTFEQKSIDNTVNHKVKNLKNLQFYSLKNRNIKKDNKKLSPILLNNFENINNENKIINERHSVGIQGNNFLFNFLKDNNKEFNRNKSFGYQLQNCNYNSNFDSRESSIYEDSILSFYNNNKIKNNLFNYSNTFNEKEKEINILNKTKEILKLKEDESNNLNNLNNLKLRHFFNKSQSFFNGFRKSFINNKIFNFSYNSNPNKIHNNKYFIQRTFNPTNYFFYNNRKPCSLHYNKQSIKKDIIDMNNINNNRLSLNDYYKNVINRNNQLDFNLNNISRNNINIDNFKFNKKQKEIEINKDLENNIKENIKTNLYDKKYININKMNSSQQLFNKRLKVNNNIFKFNRNKNKNKNKNNRSKKNSILDYIPTFIKINKTYN